MTSNTDIMYIKLPFGFTWAAFCRRTGKDLNEIKALNPTLNHNDIYVGAKWRIQ